VCLEVPKIKFTDLPVKRLKVPEKGQKTYWDTALPGFGVRVSQGGAKSFILMFGEAYARKRVTVGRYPGISLADARAEAKETLAKITLGKYQDPRRPSSKPFNEAVDGFLKLHCSQRNRASTAKETERLLRKHFYPPLQNFPLEEITPHHINRILDRLLRRTPSEANHAFGVIRKFFSWTRERGYLATTPCDGMKIPARKKSRDRFLDDDELGQAFYTAGATGHPYGTLVQLLLLTGQRRFEIIGLRWDWIDDGQRTITFPKDFTKTGVIHTIPLTPMMEAVFDTVPRLDEFLFSSRGDTPGTFSGFSKCKNRFDLDCPIDHWTLHDLRRTFATHLASLRIQPHVIERLLNHSSGTISGVAAIYNRFSYIDEMREALTLWERKLTCLTSSGA